MHTDVCTRPIGRKRGPNWLLAALARPNDVLDARTRTKTKTTASHTRPRLICVGVRECRRALTSRVEVSRRGERRAREKKLERGVGWGRTIFVFVCYLILSTAGHRSGACSLFALSVVSSKQQQQQQQERQTTHRKADDRQQRRRRRG